MRIRAIIGKFRDGDIAYAVGRFRLIGRIHAFFLAFLSKLGVETNALPPLDDCRDIDIAPADRIVAELKNNSYSTGIRLLPDLTSELRHVMEGSRLEGSGGEGKFAYADARTFTAENNVVLAYVVDLDKWPAIERIRRDGRILNVVEKYLGFAPRKADARLMVSFVHAAVDATRLAKNQTINYHYDVHALNQLYLNFYISDVDDGAGPHALIPGTHGSKPLRYLFSSANRSFEEIKQWRADAEEQVMLGAAGFGFFEDTNCYHKATPPSRQQRAMLQIRYW